MKKLLFVFTVAVLMVSCSTVNQVPTYGAVEDIIAIDGHYQLKVWSGSKYYTVITDKPYQINEIIRIK
jgi:hypothetical protein